MENKLFRKQTMERISSPEELHDFMKATSPKRWMIMIAIAVLLVGYIAYAAAAQMETTMDATLNVHQLSYPEDDGTDHYYYVVTGLLPDSAYGTVQKGMTVRIGDVEGKIAAISSLVDEGVLITVDIEYAKAAGILVDGEYEAQIVLETTTPLSFLLN